MHSKFLLYIEICHLNDTILNDAEQAQEIYEVISKCNFNRHPSFKVVAISGTVLVYTPEDVVSGHDKHCIIMYMCEFMHDLITRFTSREFAFKAVIECGDLVNTTINSQNHIYGDAIFKAKHAIKSIKPIGLTINNNILKYCTAFKAEKINSSYSFVFLAKSLFELENKINDIESEITSYLSKKVALMDTEENFFPIDVAILESFCDPGSLYCDIKYMELLQYEFYLCKDRAIQKGSSYALKLYWKHCPKVLHTLLSKDFSPTAICENFDWDRFTSCVVDIQ